MSQLSEKVRKALYAKLSGDAVLISLAVGGIHWHIAPPNVADCFVILKRIPVSVNYALADNLTYERDLWAIKAVVGEDFSQAKSAPDLCAEINAAVETATQTGITIGGTDSIAYFRRTSEIPEYQEKSNDQVFYHAGANYSVVASK